jgi:hypothetical protein
MPRRVYDLIEKTCQVEKAIAGSVGQVARRHPCGGNLYLVTGNGFGSWTVQFYDKALKKVRATGLGSAAIVTLAKARDKAANLKADARRGKVPAYRPKCPKIATAAPAAPDDTFGYWADRYLAAKPGEKAWTTDPTYRKTQWLKVLAASLAPMPVASITPADVAAALGIDVEWSAVAKRARLVVETVFSYAAANGAALPKGNPAAVKIIKTISAPKSEDDDDKNHPALPYARVAEFVRSLPDTLAGRCMAFLIHSAGRPGRVRAMDWTQVDLAARTWTIPKTKNGKRIVVPLTDDAIALLGTPGEGPIFPDVDARTLLKFCKGWPSTTPGSTATVAGMRSVASTWAADTHAAVPEPIREMMLWHVKGGIEGRYNRAEHLDARRKLMIDWSAFVTRATAVT